MIDSQKNHNSPEDDMKKGACELFLCFCWYLMWKVVVTTNSGLRIDPWGTPRDILREGCMTMKEKVFLPVVHVQPWNYILAAWIISGCCFGRSERPWDPLTGHDFHLRRLRDQQQLSQFPGAQLSHQPSRHEKAAGRGGRHLPQQGTTRTSSSNIQYAVIWHWLKIDLWKNNDF